MAGMSLDAIILIYRISHEMQVESLVVHLDKLLKKTKAPKIFAVFNLYQTINCQECIAFSKEVLIDQIYGETFLIIILDSGNGNCRSSRVEALAQNEDEQCP